MKKKLIIYISSLITLLKNIFFVPIVMSGGFAGIYKLEYMSIFKVISILPEFSSCNNRFEVVPDCLYFGIHYYKFIFESILVFVISISFLYFLYLLTNRKNLKKGKVKTKKEKLKKM